MSTSDEDIKVSDLGLYFGCASVNIFVKVNVSRLKQ